MRSVTAVALLVLAVATVAAGCRETNSDRGAPAGPALESFVGQSRVGLYSALPDDHVLMVQDLSVLVGTKPSYSGVIDSTWVIVAICGSSPRLAPQITVAVALVPRAEWLSNEEFVPRDEVQTSIGCEGLEWGPYVK